MKTELKWSDLAKLSDGTKKKFWIVGHDLMPSFATGTKLYYDARYLSADFYFSFKIKNAYLTVNKSQFQYAVYRMYASKQEAMLAAKTYASDMIEHFQDKLDKISLIK